jgi:nucleotidyltransferase/DNA polymerase involved in DNA repair
MMKYLRENTLSVEPFSIDEAFCEITGLPEMYGIDIQEYVCNLQKQVMDYI